MDHTSFLALRSLHVPSHGHDMTIRMEIVMQFCKYQTPLTLNTSFVQPYFDLFCETKYTIIQLIIFIKNKLAFSTFITKLC